MDDIKAVNGIKHDPTNLVYFETGAHRSAASGKGRFDLISPEGLRRLAIKYEQGGINHEDRNWEKGMPFSRLLDSAMRHCNDYLGGDRSEDHLAAVAWNVFAIMHFEKHKPELNDLPEPWKSPQEKTQNLNPAPSMLMEQRSPTNCVSTKTVVVNTHSPLPFIK